MSREAGKGSKDMDRKPSDAQKENEPCFMKELFIAETKLDSFCGWSIVVCLN